MKNITSETYLKWFKDMCLWRRFEDKCRYLYFKQKIRGFLHLYNGQEAIAAGVTHAIDLNKDIVITAYRCHILAIAMGVDPKIVMAELYGKITGTSKGIGGSMHIFSKKNRFYGGYGIVGGQIPIGAGIAFADKYFGRNSVTLTFMGDGAVNQGSLHETFNMAMNWKLPVIFICENNKYAMGTSVERSTYIKKISQIGLAYNMQSIEIDGMDPAKIAYATYEAVEKARKGYGPTFLEMRTYRYRGHSVSDAENYRTKDEILKYKEKDPILKIKNMILTNKWYTEKDIKEIEYQINIKIDKCVNFAEKSDFPYIDTMYNTVYYQKDYPFVDKIINK
ncbi:MAG: pyruvate dehydrogenase (acetyl-transferring) E1 component subunit alpha [Candidatus Bostrichicola ureolyticus]|nr:MAG: pyruvate dehydrogenase (acetyl-transferring) E1 component subunit alpha [Candidatus Bostrichicola ureolyticus]